MRHLLGRSFSARRLAALRPRVQDLVDGLLDELARKTPPVDLHDAISFPLPALVICELLGCSPTPPSARCCNETPSSCPLRWRRSCGSPSRCRTRTPDEPPDLTFGHGAHFCVGAPLARMELQALFGTLFTRFPTLELAVPVEELRPRSHLLTGGLDALPVTW